MEGGKQVQKTQRPIESGKRDRAVSPGRGSLDPTPSDPCESRDQDDRGGVKDLPKNQAHRTCDVPNEKWSKNSDVSTAGTAPERLSLSRSLEGVLNSGGQKERPRVLFDLAVKGGPTKTGNLSWRPVK